MFFNTLFKDAIWGFQMQNSKLPASVIALVVFSLPLLNSSVIATPLDARFVNQNAFLYGDNIEVGIAPDGAFGSEVGSPTGIMQGKLLGYISDPSKQGFNNGYHGDFFLPQVPEEGWAIRMGGKTYNNNRNQQWSGINGSITSTNKTGTTASAIWKGKLDGLEITQTFRIYKAGLAVIIDISLKNTTANVMKDVYYMRTVDPDNNAEQNTAANNPYETVNTIMRQGDLKGGAAVVATQSKIPDADNMISKTRSSVLGLCGHGENSRVAHGGTDNINFPYYRDPKIVYEGSQTIGNSKTEDSPIAIAFKFDNIFSGQTIKFRAGYQLADITPPTVDIDTDDSSGSLGNTFSQVYILGSAATAITDHDITISKLGNETLIGATIKISNAFPDDLLAINGTLPNGISIDANEDSSDTEIHLTGLTSKANYIKALQQITFVNAAVTGSAKTRRISIMVLDSNYTASTAATSIINVVIPVTLKDDSITSDNLINASEANRLIIAGTSAFTVSVSIVFTDKNGQKVEKTVTSDSTGHWKLDNNPADLSTLADGVMTVDMTSTDSNNNQSSYTKISQKDTVVLLTITSPQDGKIATSTSPVITGTSDPKSTIEISLSGKRYTTVADDSGNWTITLPKQTLGVTLALSITAKDPVNNSNNKTLSIIIPSIPLKIAEVTSSTTPTFTGTSTPKTKVTVTVPTTNGNFETCTTTTDANGKWSCQLPVLSSGGPYVATIKTEDDKGNASTITHEITVPTLPLVIETPLNNASTSDSSPIISGTSTPETIITVTASTGETCKTVTDKTGKWRCEMPILPLNSAIKLTVVTKDKAGNTTTKSIDITTPKLALKITGIDISTTPTFTGTSTPGTRITVTIPISETITETCTTVTKTDGSWSCTSPILPSGGPYTATVKAEDNNGNYSTDTQVLSTPDISLSIDSHADNAKTFAATPTISGTSTPKTTITLTASTGQSCTTTTDSKGQWQCTIPKLPLSKTITLTVKTEDSIGNSVTKTITLTTPALPVSVTKIESSTQPTVRGTSTPKTTIIVNVPVNDSLTQTCEAITDRDGQWSCQLPSLPTGGPYTATINAEDEAGNASSIAHVFNVPELPLIIDNPSNNAVISGSTPTISGTSLPKTTITVTASTGQSCTTVTDSSNHWSCELPSLPLDNKYTLEVITKDNIGNTTTQSIDLSTDKLPLAIISPEDKGTASDSTPHFIGTTTVNTTITITAETGQECQTVADEKGNWNCELPEMPIGGPYRIIIKAEDGNGNISTITETIIIPKTPLIITSPIHDQTLTETSVNVTGTSDANTPITVLGPDGERCVTTSDDKGAWQCQLDNLQSGDNKHITVISGETGTGQKISLVMVNIKNSGEKVTTILKGGGGSLSFFLLFLMGFGLLLKNTITKKNN